MKGAAALLGMLFVGTFAGALVFAGLDATAQLTLLFGIIAGMFMTALVFIISYPDDCIRGHDSEREGGRIQ